MRLVLFLALLTGCSEGEIKVHGYADRNITVTVSAPIPEVRYVQLPVTRTRTITVPFAVPLVMNPAVEAR